MQTHADLKAKLLTVGLIAAEAASFAYAIFELLMLRDLGAFVANNMPGYAGQRAFLCLVTYGAAAVAVGVAAAVVRRNAAIGWSGLRRLALQWMPLLVIWAVPGLLSRSGFAGRDLLLLICAALAVLAFEPCMRQALTAHATADEAAERANARAADVTVAILVIGYVLLASQRSILLHHKLLTSTFDLGVFENLFWNILHGAQGIALEQKYFGYHAELIVYPLLPVYAALPRPETLLVIQSVLLGGAAVPLYLLARHCLRNPWQAVVIALAYLLSPLVHGPNFYDFHCLTLSVFFVLWAAYFYFAGPRWAFWVAVLFALSCREDVTIGAAAIGLGIALLTDRFRTGLVLSVLGASCFVLEKLFWMRGLAGETFAGNYGRLVAPETVGFGGVFQTLISNPLYVLGAVLSTEKLVLALQLFVPLAFLPVRRAKTLFLLIPGAVIIGLATDSPAVAQIHFQYVCHFVPYLFIAAVVVLASMGRRQRIAALAAVALGTAIATQHFGALLHEDFKVSFQEVSFSWSAEDDRHLADLRAIIGAIPPDRSLAVGDYEGAHTARRRHLLDIKSGIHGSDYVLYGVRSFRWGGLDEVRAALASGVYGVVARRGEFAVLARGADPGGNVAELERLSH